jgi:hypothetical protein
LRERWTFHAHLRQTRAQLHVIATAEEGGAVAAVETDAARVPQSADVDAELL